MRLPRGLCVLKPVLNSVTHFQKPQAGLQAPTAPNIDSLQEPSLSDAADVGKQGVPAVPTQAGAVPQDMDDNTSWVARCLQ